MNYYLIVCNSVLGLGLGAIINSWYQDFRKIVDKKYYLNYVFGFLVVVVTLLNIIIVNSFFVHLFVIFLSAFLGHMICFLLEKDNARFIGTIILCTVLFFYIFGIGFTYTKNIQEIKKPDEITKGKSTIYFKIENKTIETTEHRMFSENDENFNIKITRKINPYGFNIENVYEIITSTNK